MYISFGLNKFLAPLPRILVSLSNSGRNLVIHNFGQQVFGVVARDRRNLKINILTKERNANLDIFLCFTKVSEINKNSFTSSG